MRSLYAEACVLCMPHDPRMQDKQHCYRTYLEKNGTAADPQERDKVKAASLTKESGWFYQRDGIVNDKELYLSLLPAQLVLVLA